MMINVLLVTPWDTPCGIAEHSAYLKASVEAADPEIRLQPWSNLHPESLYDCKYPIIHLNYHAALHSQWTPDFLRAYQGVGHKILVTFHDTGVPNSDQCKAICVAADCAVVHEPFDDLEGNVHYIRQGVPDWGAPVSFAGQTWCGLRPIVGTVGFPFPWKNYDLLCEASARAGWATLILAPGATAEQIVRWSILQPHLQVRTAFTPHEEVVALLAGCNATAFLYACANTGTSAAIRQGIAARKPVLAFSACRQFRDLELAEDLEHPAITWLTEGSPTGVAKALTQVPIGRVYPPMVALAERDSWERMGQHYATLYRQLGVR